MTLPVEARDLAAARPIAAEEPILEARDVSKAYRLYARPVDRLRQALFGSTASRYYSEFHALHNVDLTIRRGEAVALVGRNGAGKSTLLQIISGVLAPTSGTVAIRGRIAPLLELGTSFNPEFTGLENISLAASVLGLTEEQIRDRRDAIIAFADIGEHIAQPVRTYSSGMYARLAFAVAAHVDADILIVDEVLAVGDIRFTQKCMRFIREFRERGTLLFVSHDVGAVLAICDRAVWLDRGRVVEDSTPREVIQHYKAFMANPDEAADAVAFRAAQGRAQEAAEETAQAEPPPPAEVAADGPEPAVQGQPGTRIRFDGFDWSAHQTGDRNASITDAYWLDRDGRRATTLEGGQEVTLAIEVEAAADILSPIIGFGVLDRLGQVVFAWDTSREPDLVGRPLRAGERVAARFTLPFPYLARGSYSLNLAVADGGIEAHAQEHWVYHGLTFEVTWSRLVHGIIGVPMRRVSVEPVS